MAQTTHQGAGENNGVAGLVPQEFAKMGKGYVDPMMKAQAGFLHEFQKANEEWIANSQSKLNLVSDLFAKVMAARSMPEVTTAYQDWAAQRASLFAEEARSALAHGQKFLEAGTQLVSNGSLGGNAAWPARWLEGGRRDRGIKGCPAPDVLGLTGLNLSA